MVSLAPAPVARLEDERVAVLLGERPHLVRRGRRRVEAAVGTPASRSACFIDGLSRHSQVVRTDVPGMPVASRTWAAGIVCASTVASSRSTQTLDWMKRTASVISCDVRHRAHAVVAGQRVAQLVVELPTPRDSPMPMTLAPTEASARANRRWFAGNAGSTKMMFTGLTLEAPGHRRRTNPARFRIVSPRMSAVGRAAGSAPRCAAYVLTR